MAKSEKKTSKNGAPPEGQKPPGYFEGESLTRRKLFEQGALAVGGIASAAVALPAIGFALGPVFEAAAAPYTTVGPLSEFTQDKYVSKTITVVQGIGESGKTTTFVRKCNPKTDRPDPSGTGFIAISTRCTHLGCPVSYVEAARNFVCPCHTSVYDFQGSRVIGPAVRPLDQFYTRILEDGNKKYLQVGPRYSVTDNLSPVPARDPSQPTSPKIWRILYPSRPSVRNWKKPVPSIIKGRSR